MVDIAPIIIPIEIKLIVDVVQPPEVKIDFVVGPVRNKEKQEKQEKI